MHHRVIHQDEPLWGRTIGLVDENTSNTRIHVAGKEEPSPFF